jgi:ligand-binding sensor domain-containing protein
MVDMMGIVWFGTPEGLSYYFPPTIRNITVEQGLSSNNILSIAVDHDGVLWLGTDNGITSYDLGVITKYQNKQ